VQQIVFVYSHSLGIRESGWLNNVKENFMPSEDHQFSKKNQLKTILSTKTHPKTLLCCHGVFSGLGYGYENELSSCVSVKRKSAFKPPSFLNSESIEF
jgi:hypothetical protein